jgi:hypothetical protein
MKRRVGRLSDSHQIPGNGAGRIHTLLMLPAAAWSAEGRGYLDLSGGYKTGDFGTPVKSNLYYLSSAPGYVTPRYEAAVTIPYLFLTEKAAGQTVTEEGIGDIILRGGKVLVPETENGFSLTGSIAVKFGTADGDKGLGTGETDYGGFLGFRQRFGRNRVTLSAGYIKVGSPAGADLNDVYVYDIGYARIFAGTELSAWYEGRKALVPGASNPQEINVGFFHIVNPDYSVKGGFFAGLNNGGPDFGLSLGIVRWF